MNKRHHYYIYVSDFITSTQVFLSLMSKSQPMCKIWSAYDVILGCKWNTSFVMTSST